MPAFIVSSISRSTIRPSAATKWAPKKSKKSCKKPHTTYNLLENESGFSGKGVTTMPSLRSTLTEFFPEYAPWQRPILNTIADVRDVFLTVFVKCARRNHGLSMGHWILRLSISAMRRMLKHVFRITWQRRACVGNPAFLIPHSNRPLYCKIVKVTN